MTNRKILSVVLLAASALSHATIHPSDTLLWLRRTSAPGTATVTCNRTTSTARIAADELRRGLGADLTADIRIGAAKDLSSEQYRIDIRSGHCVIASRTDVGALYAAYDLLRQRQLRLPADTAWTSAPSYGLRMLNHWDNLDGTIERGYAGRSLWQWSDLPGKLSVRYEQYARANASIGINAVVLNNVNAAPEMLADTCLRKVAAIADVMRPYGIRVFLAINFSSPAAIGGLPTSDPLDAGVARWWRRKADAIYALIPDFGGFLVKANSEGLPGPQDFGRTHADGANMLARALAPHKGVVVWRAFVYSPSDADRAKQACQEFLPLDGCFADNVVVQVKNGPVDFQPREPFSPLFGAMRHTAVAAELQITQEYTGFSNHICFLAPMWHEVLTADTHRPHDGCTVASAITAMAGVANVGDSPDWCGNTLAQANWYAFGRMAWDNALTPQQIAREWIALTFGLKGKDAEPIERMMLMSHEAVVDYMMPMGLHHLFAWGHHYGPEPWCDVPGARPDWMPSYYHKAAPDGIGFDRSSLGSNAVAQYADTLARLYGSPQLCPEKYLLWFHHMAWDASTASGSTVWDALCAHYQAGVDSVRAMQKLWQAVSGKIEPDIHESIGRHLRTQLRDAIWWKDGCLQYFGTFSRRPLPAGVEEPMLELDEMRRFGLDIDNYTCPPRGFF